MELGNRGTFCPFFTKSELEEFVTTGRSMYYTSVYDVLRYIFEGIKVVQVVFLFQKAADTYTAQTPFDKGTLDVIAVMPFFLFVLPARFCLY